MARQSQVREPVIRDGNTNLGDSGQRGRDQRQEFNLAQNAHGVVVQGVKNTSDASDKGMQRGDVIVRAGDRDVASTGDVAAAVDIWKKAGRKEIPLAVSRGGRIVFLPLKIDG